MALKVPAILVVTEVEMPRTVIIADDAPFMRTMLKGIVENMGFEVVAEAGNGDEAVERHLHHRPTLTILDVTMPGSDGVDAARRIVAADPQAVVVMACALGQKEEVLAAIKAGARDFVIKPFETDRVEAVLQSLLERLPVGANT
jgi:two-component system, chemotaxis family, chemotaxis protein CheY